jgi:uncharacterized protein (TIGR00288 family)
MSTLPPLPQRRIALLVDCENVGVDAVSFALERMRAHGKVTIRRGYGGQCLLGSKWKEVMLQLALTPQLHYSAISGKNTADIALALDCLELVMSGQVDMVCLVTSDSDFTYLCTKLRERACLTCVVGKSQTPEALKAASDSFYEFVPATVAVAPQAPVVSVAPVVPVAPASPPVSKEVRAVRILLTNAVRAMRTETGLTHIPLPAFGQYLRAHHCEFSVKDHGHAKLSKMLVTVPMLDCRVQDKTHMVSLRGQ